ncbi:MAG: MerR family transcriptional regulator [Gammaproteobacteria bacterium]|nr:MerR family transcriptional regulator [Gammaproteobacteria bacterium]
MKISQLASKAGVTKDTIRHYVSIGLLSPERDRNNGYQIFGTQALSRLRFIKTARQLGLHLDDIQQIFSDAKEAHSPCPRVREMMQQRILETRKTIEELTLLCDRMEASMAEWEEMPDSVPDGHSVCRLIESQIDLQQVKT